MNAATETVALLNPTAAALAALNEWGIKVQVSGSGYGPRVYFVQVGKATAREMRNEKALGRTFNSVAAAHRAISTECANVASKWNSNGAVAAVRVTTKSEGWDR